MRDFPFENPMNRGAKIAGWIYFPIHVVVLPLFLGTALYLIAGTMPSDITCNICTMPSAWRSRSLPYGSSCAKAMRTC